MEASRMRSRVVCAVAMPWKQGSAVRRLREKRTRRILHGVICSSSSSPEAETSGDNGGACSTRRGALMLGSFVVLGGANAPLASAIAEKPVEVSSYLKEAPGLSGFFEFVPSEAETPAIRAGTISRYRFAMPGTWIRRTVANILSGNYCQPRCDEPWTEVLFSGPQEGSLQVIVAPLNKLSRSSLSAGQSIDTVGTLDGIINALGPNITGNTIEEEEVVRAESKRIDGLTYYWYTLDTPYAKTGQRQVASITAKDDAVFVMAVSCTQKQWERNEDKLKTIAESFRV